MDKELRILMLEDVPADAKLIERELCKEGIAFSSKRVETRETFLKELQDFRPDLIFGDYGLPSFDGLTALGLAQERFPEIPFIFISGSIGEDFAIEALKKGATDYVLKDRLSRLVPAVKRAVREVQERKERKRAEQALRESNERLNLALAATRMGVWEWDVRTDKVFWSQECYKIFGVESFGETLESFMSTLHPEDADRVMTTARQAVAERTVWMEEFRIIHPDGQMHWISNLGRGGYDEKGNPLRLIGTVQDITERKESEEASRESERRFRELYDNAPVGYHEYDLEGRITRVNRTDMEMLGYTRAEMIGQPVWDFNIEWEIARKQVLEKLAGLRQPARNLERTYRRKDGTTFSVLIEDRLILDENGRITGMRCTVQDISELKRAEESLKKSEEDARRLARENAIMAEIGRIISSTLNIEEVYERFASEVKSILPFDRLSINRFNLEDQTGIVSYVIGDEIPVRYRGAKFPLTGKFNTAIIDSKTGILFQPKNEEELMELFPGLIYTYQAGLRSMMSVPLISKDQAFGVLHFRSRKPDAYTQEDLRLAERIGNQIAGAIANAQLYTDQMQAEEEKVAMEEQFRQSQKMESIGRLAGGIAHDFNNLLTVINGYSQLLMLDLKENDSLKEQVKEVQKASQRAADLVRQLLAFSRRQVMEMKVLDPNSLLRDLEKMLRRILSEDIELVTLFGEDLGRVKADPGQIQQVIMNLAVNARDAMPSGGKLTIKTGNVKLDEVYARTHVGPVPGRYVMLSVDDTGVGMPPEVKEKIFEPFYTTKERDKGTGLGLSTVYGIVKQSGGDIRVYSEPGRGTRFEVYLPRVEEALDELRTKATGEELPRGSETILLVEDEEKVRELAARVLERQGYRVLKAAHGDEALLIFEKENGPIRLVLTDVVMPGMNGRNLAERLRGLVPNLKVLYMSGYTGGGVIDHEIFGGGMGYIQKPFTVGGLVRKVREVLDK